MRARAKYSIASNKTPNEAPRIVRAGKVGGAGRAHVGGELPNLTLAILIPLYYNPARGGLRMAVEPAKLKKTESEIRKRFSGYSRSAIDGWWRDESSGKEFDDRLIRFEIDSTFDNQTLGFLRQWKRTLERRFRQRAIYFKFSPVWSW